MLSAFGHLPRFVSLVGEGRDLRAQPLVTFAERKEVQLVPIFFLVREADFGDLLGGENFATRHECTRSRVARCPQPRRLLNWSGYARSLRRGRWFPALR